MRVKKFDENGNKVCPGCDTAKPREGYYTSKGQQSSRCKSCVDLQNKAWQEANPEKYRAAQRAWKEANEGHTYADENGYIKYIGYKHPIANACGITAYHRVVLFDLIGAGEHECYWECGKTVSWDVNHLEDPKRGLVVDHLNGDKQDNRPENLVPSCQGCNSGVSRLSRKVTVTCAFDDCGNEAAVKGFCKGHYMQKYLGKEMTPLRNKVMAHRDENGRVCTGCDEYKTYDHFSKNSFGNYRSKCGKCLSVLATKGKEARKARGIECSVDDCKDPSLNKGLCQRHYNRDYYKKVREVA